MPGLTLHLLSLEAGTGPQSFVKRLRDYPNVKVIVASRPRLVVTRPTYIDVCHLSTTKWDLLVLLQAPNNSIPAVFRPIIRCEYHISVGVPSKLIDNYPELDARLKRTAPSISLTGALGKPQQRKELLQISPESLKSMDDLFEEHNKPITMLNLLNFFPRGGKQSYFQYGQAFIPIAEKRGGYAKIVGNVVKPLASSGDSRADRLEQDWWNEISIVHYPSVKHFYDLIAGEDYQAINRQFRLTALRDTLLLCTTEFDVEETHTSKL